ncbi:MAG: ATP-grasp domain-containing protein [Sphaerospermopsis sp. SIO1G2]|nr:ATP-grasp domain-containing protein [Sphaerospermopsis sp. SIO1G2]
MKSLFQNIGTLLLLFLMFPINLALVIIVSITNFFTLPFQTKATSNNPKNVLLTGGKMTKSLQLARSFHRAGHRVFMVETHKYWLSGHKFSNAVQKFYTVAAPEKDSQGYIQGLLDIVKAEKIDIFIPVSSPVASYYDSLAKSTLSPYCEVFHFDAEMTKTLDDKFSLCEQARVLGLTAPKVFLINSPAEIINFDFSQEKNPYIIKSIQYDSVTRLDMTKFPFQGMEEYVKTLPISKERPWVMQEFIKGQEYCTHSTVRDGEIRLHCCSQSSPFQVNYEQVDNPEILKWVQKFVKELNLTGQISFDFMQTEDGKVYPIECNPRTHTAITMFHDHPGLADAYLEPGENQPHIEPLPTSKPTYWLYHELWRITGIRSFNDLKNWLIKVTKGKDAMLDKDDPLPFLMVHNWQIVLLLIQNLVKFKGWVKIDFNIGKLVEIGGD